jgi:uncharacterized protein GlcG (DUF336 family)
MQETKSIGLKEARHIVRAIIEASEKSEGMPMCAAVLDRHGDLVCLERMDGAMPKTAAMSVNKAYSALQFLRDTIESRQIQAKLDIKPYEFCDPHYSTIEGGVLLKTKDGTIVGALGTGGRAPMAPMGDEELARVGEKAFKELMS